MVFFGDFVGDCPGALGHLDKIVPPCFPFQKRCTGVRCFIIIIIIIIISVILLIFCIAIITTTYVSVVIVVAAIEMSSRTQA